MAQRSGLGLKSQLSLFLHQMHLQQVLSSCRYGDASHNGVNLSKQLSLFRGVRESSREVCDLCCVFGPDALCILIYEACVQQGLCIAAAIFFGWN